MNIKFSIFLITLTVSLNLFAQQTINTDNIEFLINRFDKKQVVRNKNGWFHYFIPKGMADTLTVKMSCIFEGIQTHPPHFHNEDEVFYIVKGPVNFHINNEERILVTGDFIYTPSGSSHNIQRINNDTIKYLVIKREWLTSLEKPFNVGKNNYTFEDCYILSEKDPQFDGEKKILLSTEFSNGLQIALNKISPGKSLSNDGHVTVQTAIYIIKGESEIIFNGQRAIITENNTFYCPKGFPYKLCNNIAEPLIFLSIITK